MRKRIASIIIFSLIVYVIAPFVGGTWLSISDVTHFRGADAEIFWVVRLPRVLMSIIAGSVLSVGGLVFQSLFKNPLATPYTLGIASGASLGTSLFFVFGLSAIPQMLGTSVFAFFGALLAVMLVFAIGRATGGGVSLLLAGVALNFSFSSVIMFVQYMSNFISSHRIIRFMIGGLDTASLGTVLWILPFSIAGCLLIMFYRRELDLIAAGDDIAQSRGVNVAQVKFSLYFIVSIMLAVVISVTGPIGFVGMMAPHICRLIVGGTHTRLIPVSIVFGGAFLTLCDIFARVLIYPTEIPVGVITSMLGGPFFILLLLKQRFSKSF